MPHPYNDPERWAQFEGWKAAGRFLPRLTMTMGTRGFELSPEGYRSALVDEVHLSSGSVKIVIQEVTGRLYPRQEELNKSLLAIHQAGLQAVFHAVEEEAIEAACTAVAYALRFCPRRDHRHRIEHCSLCTPRLADRIGDLGIAVVTQPPFIYYSGDRYLKTVPPDNQGHLYALRTMLQRGLLVGASSDFPIADPDPLVGIYAAVTRRSEAGSIVGSKEGVTPLEAINMYTLSAAMVHFAEARKGSLHPGKVADFAVLSDDPLRVDPRHIKDINVEMTILGGRVVYSREADSY
jgi:predicted amidohydrolase YtcJ